MQNIMVRKYEVAKDEKELFQLLEKEGQEWSGYWQGSNRTKYQKALMNSLVYVLFEGEVLCGFIRCRDDDGFGVYVYDLLVDKDYRGKNYGNQLMTQLRNDYPDQEAYVMSDVDGYYNRVGYERIGSIFQIK